MYCYKCGKEVADGTRFCTNCGADLNNPSVNNSNTVNSGSTFTYGEEEELLRVYVGSKYDSFTAGTFNIWAFLFPSIYCLYRKCYLYFFLFFLIPLVPLLGWIGLIVYWIILAINFNKWYLNKAREDVMYIKRVNYTAGMDELKQKVAKKGGVNIIGPIIYLFVMFAIIALCFYAFMAFVEHIDDFILYPYYNDYFDTYGSEDDYDGHIVDEYSTGVDRGKIVDLYYNIPLEYSLNNYKKDTVGSYSYNYGNNSSCKVDITYVDKSDEEYMDSIEIDRTKWVEENIRGNAYKTTIINTTNLDGTSLSTNYYVINKYNKTYTITFNDSNDIEERCTNIRNKLMEQVRFNHTLTAEDLDVA